MNGLLAMLNHLAATALAGSSSGGALQFRSIVLDPDGGRIVARVDHPQCSGEVVLRLQVVDSQAAGESEESQGRRQTIYLTLESVPEKLGPHIEPFRRVLEKARLRLELDFEP